MKSLTRSSGWIKTNTGTFIVVTLLYAAICTILLHSYVFHLTDTLNGENDVLLNIWIMQWTFHQLFHDPFHLFDGNIFYPNKRTLAYSEVLFPNAFLSGAITTLSGNPILAYNLVFFLMIIGSALAMFYFTHSFTKSTIASFVAGAIFAFPLKNMGFLQLLASLWIPLSFLFFFKSFQKGDRKSVFLTCFFFIFQFLSCVYYGLYLMLCFMILSPFFLISFRKRLRISFFVWSLIGVLLSVVILSPFLYQYYRTSKDFGFTRDIELFSGADLKDFIVPSINNLILGKARKFIRPLIHIRVYKRDLGLGIIALAVATFGVISFLRRRKAKRRTYNPVNYSSKRIHFLKTFSLLYLGIMTFISASVVIYQISGAKTFFSIFYTLTEDNYIFFFRVAAIGITIYLLYRYARLMKEETKLFPKIYYTLVFIGIIAIILSMGDTLYIFGRFYGQGPYLLVNKYIPGFSALRVYKRFSIIAIFSLAFLTGWGAKLMTERFKKRWLRYAILTLLCFLMLVEFKAIAEKKQSFRLPHGRDIPKVYQWLKTIKGEKIIVEFPFVIRIEKKNARKITPSRKMTNLYLYYSTFHWKTLVNGRSGFFPNSDKFLVTQLYLFPTFDNLHLLKQIGVEYIIVHKIPPHLQNLYRGADYMMARQIYPNLKNFYGPYTKTKGILRLEKEFNNAMVFSFNENFKEEKFLEIKSMASESISPSSFKISSPYPDSVNVKLTDGRTKAPVPFFNYDKNTFFIQFDFEKPENIMRFEIGYAHFLKGAADLRCEISEDGIHWKPVRIFADKYEVFLKLLEGKKWRQMNYFMDGKPVRHLRLCKPRCITGEVRFSEIQFFRKK